MLGAIRLSIDEAQVDVMATVEQFMGQKGSDHIPNSDTFDKCLCSPGEAGCTAMIDMIPSLCS